MYRKSSQGWLKHFDFILLDLLCLQWAFVLSYMIRSSSINPYDNPLYRNMGIFIILADLVVIFFNETFKGVLKRGYYRELAITVKQAVIVEVLAVMYLFTIKDAEAYSRIMMYIMGVLYIFIAYIMRLIWKKFLKNKMITANSRSLLVITTSDIAASVICNIKKHNYEAFKIAGIVVADKDMIGEVIEGVPVVATTKTAVNYVCREWIDEVFINFAPGFLLPKRFIEQFIETGVTVHLNLARTTDVLGQKKIVEKIGDYIVLTSSLNFATSKQAFMKRTMDIVGGFVGCILTGIIFLFIAPVVYIQSPGPIFFSQTRIGKNGKKFKMYKFRSMYMDAEERKKELMKENRVKDGMMFKMDFDPRVIGNKVLPDGERKTGIGNFIRVTSLDEFPQFWNVLKGDMSLIGTRPPTVDEFDMYESHHCARLAVKPGITGMWQVSGRSDITDFEEVVRLDTQYINEWSMSLDLKILLKTVAVVFKKDGSL